MPTSSNATHPQSTHRAVSATCPVHQLREPRMPYPPALKPRGQGFSSPLAERISTLTRSISRVVWCAHGIGHMAANSNDSPRVVQDSAIANGAATGVTAASAHEEAMAEVHALTREPWGRSDASSRSCEHAINLRLRHGEVGCWWQTEDGSSPPAAVTAAMQADSVRMHPDEFLEAFAHSHLGQWGAEFLGFRAEHSLLPLMPRNGSAPELASLAPPSVQPATVANPPSPRSPSPHPPLLLKRLVFTRLHTTYKDARALCLRITSRSDARQPPASGARQRARIEVLISGDVEEAALEVQNALSEQPPPYTSCSGSSGASGGSAASASSTHPACNGSYSGDVLDQDGGRGLADAVRLLLGCVPAESRSALLQTFCSQIGGLIEAMAEGSYFQFGAASLWCICEAGEASLGGGADGRSAPAVRLTHFSDMSMHRHASCNPAFLSALSSIHGCLRSIAPDCDAADGTPMGGGCAYPPEEPLHEMNDD
mmetsp:Transcript_20684/g.52693  ORF Transcript_20684/g.52693 Transcript_20684/m.52693 type:complete len:484 (-) Transcript_20684:693-2144(-)